MVGSTRNISFYKMFHYLSTQTKVENNDFMLTLLDERLEGVDPHVCNNDTLQQLIYLECVRNPWYFFREVLKVPVHPKKSSVTRCYNLNSANMAQIYCWLNGVNTWRSTPRQTGNTLDTLVIMSYELIFNKKRLTIYDLNHQSALMCKFVIDQIYNNLPYYLKNIISGYADSFNIGDNITLRVVHNDRMRDEDNANNGESQLTLFNNADKMETINRLSVAPDRVDVINPSFNSYTLYNNSFEVFNKFDGIFEPDIKNIQDMLKWDDSLYDEEFLVDKKYKEGIDHLDYDFYRKNRSKVLSLYKNIYLITYPSMDAMNIKGVDYGDMGI